jgi:hypothetical protein
MPRWPHVIYTGGVPLDPSTLPSNFGVNTNQAGRRGWQKKWAQVKRNTRALLDPNVKIPRFYKTGIDVEHPGIGTIPRDAEWYEEAAILTLAHAAAPDFLRLRSFEILDTYVNIDDEACRIFDVFTQTCTLNGRTDGSPQAFHFFLVKGPSTMTVTDGDYSPSGGFRTAIEDACANGSEIKHLDTIMLKPFRENGSFVTTGYVTFDLKDKLNAFIEESERALGQGRLQPKYIMVVCSAGTASTNSTINRFTITAYHDRKRKLKV